MRPAASGGRAGGIGDAAEGDPQFFLSISIFYTSFLNKSIFENSTGRWVFGLKIRHCQNLKKVKIKVIIYT